MHILSLELARDAGAGTRAAVCGHPPNIPSHCSEATVSQLQEDELFYLRSRGITEVEATALLLNGYCHEVIDHLPAGAERWQLSERIHNVLITSG